MMSRTNRQRTTALLLGTLAVTFTALPLRALATETPTLEKPAAAPKGGTTGATKGGTTTTSKTAAKGTMPVKPATTPTHIKVQHILIAFDGSLPGQTIKRTKDEAKTLAYQVLEKARAGAPFDSLVKEYTNDAFPGIYGMSNFKTPPGQGEYPREGMVPAFGDVGFNISVGNIGIADFDPKTSPYGWHIIKRIK